MADTAERKRALEEGIKQLEGKIRKLELEDAKAI
jgi:hypothetical protein